MFRKKKPTLDQAESLIKTGVGLQKAAHLFYRACEEKYFLAINQNTCRAASEWGATLSLEEIKEIYAVGWRLAGLEVDSKHINWCVLVTQMVYGLIKAGGVKSVADAVAACRLMNGYDAMDATLASIEGELIKHALPFLVEKSDILDFAIALKSYRGLMLLAIALEYQPSKTFDEAVAEHKKRTEEEHRRQQNY